jgi:hypothetical protein
MPITVSWYDDERNILTWQVEGNWTIEEFYSAVTDTRALSLESPHQNHVIVNASAMASRPRGNLLPHFRNALASIELETVVYVKARGGSKFIEILVNMVFRTNSKLGVKHFRYAKTVEDAVALLEIAPVAKIAG